MLAQLAPVYYRADFGPAQAEALFAAFVDDLADFEIADIEEAVRAYRRDVKNKFYPTPAALRALAAQAAKDRIERERPRVIQPDHVLRRPQFWWLLPQWNSLWQYEEIPHGYRASFDRHMERSGRPKTYTPEPIDAAKRRPANG